MMKKLLNEVIATCGNCQYFVPHEHGRRFPGGWFVGDGKCSLHKEYTVVGDSCKDFIRKEEV